MKVGESIKVNIESLTHGGEGLGRINNKVIFVPLTAPGDTVRVEINEVKRDYLRGRIESVLKKAGTRVVPPCDYFGRCGGCHWQYLDYACQLDAKKKILRETLSRIGGIEHPACLETIPSSEFYHYRHRVKFHVRQDRRIRLGFFRERSREVIPIDQCLLLHPRINEMIGPVESIIHEYFNHIYVRNVEIKINPHEAFAVIGIHFEHEIEENCNDFIRALKIEIPNVYGICMIRDMGDSSRRENYGNCHTLFNLPRYGTFPQETIPLKISEGTFSQVNFTQNQALISRIHQHLAPDKDEVLLDLYCGNGNLSLPFVDLYKKVIGVELNDHSIEDIKNNLAGAEIKNYEFLHMESALGLDRLIDRGETVNTVILDPPRSGGKDIVERIIRLKPSKIIYVSCNPSTLARDLGFFQNGGYTLESSQAIDMFPQTYHIESISVIQRNPGR
ncbi:23S rRNA (uracil(1939)-C(5))-methyltransferase RlmD [Thermodesulfobacteriota bacterium]